MITTNNVMYGAGEDGGSSVAQDATSSDYSKLPAEWAARAANYLKSGQGYESDASGSSSASASASGLLSSMSVGTYIAIAAFAGLVGFGLYKAIKG